MNKDYNFCGLATRSEVATGLFVSSRLTHKSNALRAFHFYPWPSY